MTAVDEAHRVSPGISATAVVNSSQIKVFGSSTPRSIQPLDSLCQTLVPNELLEASDSDSFSTGPWQTSENGEKNWGEANGGKASVVGMFSSRQMPWYHFLIIFACSLALDLTAQTPPLRVLSRLLHHYQTEPSLSYL